MIRRSFAVPCLGVLSLLAFAFPTSSRAQTVTVPGTSTGTGTGIVVSVGDRITISASGTVVTLGSTEATPDGNGFGCTAECLLPSAEFGALIGRIGNNGPWFFVGSQTTFTASRSGQLILGVNDTIHDNNTGAFFASIQVDAPTVPCVVGPTTLCLSQNRFRVEISWRAPDGRTGAGNRASCGTADSGMFWFFDANNWEMLVKMVNGCSLNNRHWVFFAATTNVEFTLRVTDTRTGATREYFNPLNRLALPVADTNAFATCP